MYCYCSVSDECTKVMIGQIDVFRSWSHLWAFASSNTLELSSNALQWILSTVTDLLNPLSFSSFMMLIIGIASLIDCDNAMYSASVIDNATCVCNFECHMSGQPCNVMPYPDLLFAVPGSCSAVSLHQFPEKSASTYTSKDLSMFGWKRIPLSLVPFKYFTMCLIASACNSNGADEHHAHWRTP